MDRHDTPVVVDFPLRGEWTVERTPANGVPSHGTDAFGQRYAYDLIRTDDRPGVHPYPGGRARHLLIGGRTRDHYAWGQPVHAALDGRVVHAVDGVSEREWLHPVVEAWAALRNAIAFGRAARGRQRLDPARLAGDHVIVGSSETYALYAHLAPDSVAVHEGETVMAGQLLGHVGHTGNSTAPHLHFQLMDRADAITANGVRCAFAAYLVERGERWELVERGEPARWQRIRSIP
jgi:murein DD-endopeptidase MepM/ murein hydrolase activator NlpD